jgi:hypothetical protein
MMGKQHVKNLTQLADALSMSRQAIYKDWKDKDGFPEKGSQGWCVDDVAEFMRHYKREKETVSGAHQDLKRLKLQREIDMLDVKIAALKGELIDKQELRDEVTTICGVMSDGIDQLVQKAKLTRKPELVEIAEKVTMDVRRYIREHGSLNAD